MTHSKKNIVGKRIQKARHDQDLTQDQLSAKLAHNSIPIDRAGISKIENGDRCVYDYELKAISKVMDVSPEWLLGEK